MPASNFTKSSTPVSSVSSVAITNTVNTAGAVQSGPYTKTQCKRIFSFELSIYKRLISISISSKYNGWFTKCKKCERN